MEKKERDHLINVSRHTLFEIAWVIQFPSQSRHCLYEDSPKTLLEGKLSTKINIRVILVDDPDICGLYPLTKDKEQHYQDSIEFISEPTDLFYLQTEERS